MLTGGRPWEVVIMSNQSRQSTQPVRAQTGHAPIRHTQPGHSTLALAFDRDEWELVVTLPRRVLLAAVAAVPADGRRAAEGIAGIEAIASGLASGSPLVREVVGAIYAESYQDPDESDASTDVITVRTLAACRYAAHVVAARCGHEDAAAYREWLLHIAAVVTGVAQSVTAQRLPRPEPGIPAPAESRVGEVREPAGGRFLYALDGVLRP
jgi:hypothetical protein